MPNTVLLKDNRKLSPPELEQARRICAEAIHSVRDRSAYIERHGIDPRFALPDANWSYDAPNEFVQLFRRVAEGDPHTLAHLRGLSQVFSGYNLYHVRGSRGLSAAAMELDDRLDGEIDRRLQKRNLEQVDSWLQMTANMPFRFIFSPPRMFGEVGHDVEGVVVNSDTCTYQERINLIYETRLGEWLDKRIQARGEVRICEIGGGYGALCHWFKQAFPHASYTIIDLPESLLFSRLYMGLTRPDLSNTLGLTPAPRGVRFVPNHMAEALDDSFDLIINTLSMSEMSEYQISRYADLIKFTWLRPDGLFFEQNHDNRVVGLQCAEEVFKTKFPEHRSLASGHQFRHGSPNLWSLKPICLPGDPTEAASPSCDPVANPGEWNPVECGVSWGLGYEENLAAVTNTTIQQPEPTAVGRMVSRFRERLTGRAALEAGPSPLTLSAGPSSPDPSPSIPSTGAA